VILNSLQLYIITLCWLPLLGSIINFGVWNLQVSTFLLL